MHIVDLELGGADGWYIPVIPIIVFPLQQPPSLYLPLSGRLALQAPVTSAMVLSWGLVSLDFEHSLLGDGLSPKVSFCHCVEHSKISLLDYKGPFRSPRLTMIQDSDLYIIPAGGRAAFTWPHLGKSLPCVFHCFSQ